MPERRARSGFAQEPADSRLEGAARPLGTVLIALLLGVGLWAWLGVPGHWTVAQVIGIGLAGVVALLPPARRAIAARIEQLNAAGVPALRAAVAIVFVASALYLVSTAIFQGRDLFPKWHDHQMTLVQAQMLARGRLWMPQHALADFFETFYVFVRPVYAAMYFPGGALAFVPSVWLGIPAWVWSALIAAGVVAVLFRVVTELIDPASGVLAALLMLSLADFRRVAVWPTSHHVFTLLALVAVWAWLHWRRRPERPLAWAAVVGVALGWAAVTRPVDAVAYGLPLAFAIACGLRPVGWQKRAATALVLVATAAPFLCLQLALNRKITGSLARTPVQYYGDAEVPGLAAYGPGKDPASVKATSALPQKQAFAREFAVPLHQAFVAESRAATLKRRAAGLLEVALPGALALLLLPLGITGATRGVSWVLAVTPLTFLAGYLFSPAFLSHYCVVAAPGVVLCLVSCTEAVRRAFPGAGSAARVFVTLAVAALALGQLPEASRAEDDPVMWPVMHYNYEVLPRQVTPPAVVLFRYGPGSVFHEEPVYNIDVASPDDAPVIRAHDLGTRNRRIIEYFAARQPGRTFYRFDRADGSLTRLGTAAELAATLGPAPATEPAPGARPATRQSN